MKSKSKNVLIHASPEEVFAQMDWCLNNMLNDTKKALENKNSNAE